MRILKTFLTLAASTALLAAAMTTVATTTASAQSSPVISETGIGSAVLGSTATQLRSQLGPDYTVEAAGEVLVDVKGYEVKNNGRVVFIAAAVTGVDDLSSSTPLDIFIVRDPGPATARGIRVGMTINDGVAIYGSPTVSYNQENESREFVRFANQPDWMVLRTGGGPTAGIYAPDAEGPFFETTEFLGDATITSVWVRCSPNGCPPQPTLPSTGAATRQIAVAGLASVLVGAACLVLRRRVDNGLRRHEVAEVS